MYEGIRRSVNELGMFDDIVAAGVPNAPGAKTAILFSETSDIYLEDHGDVGAAKRALYLMLWHAQIMLDVIIEDDIVDNHAGDYAVVYFCQAHITEAAGDALARWVGAGGRLFLTAGAGLLNETNATHRALAAAMGVAGHALRRGQTAAPAEIQYIKQDLRFARRLDAVAPHANFTTGGAAATLGVYGARAVLELADAPRPADVLATFESDGAPALFRRRHGAGSLLVAAFHPGFAYFERAIPLRPVSRGSVDSTFNHFVVSADTCAFSICARC